MLRCFCRSLSCTITSMLVFRFRRHCWSRTACSTHVPRDPDWMQWPCYGFQEFYVVCVWSLFTECAESTVLSGIVRHRSSSDTPDPWYTHPQRLEVCAESCRGLEIAETERACTHVWIKHCFMLQGEKSVSLDQKQAANAPHKTCSAARVHSDNKA